MDGDKRDSTDVQGSADRPQIRCAAIDVGSNAIRCLLAEVTPGGFEVLESLRCPVRLGHEVFLNGRLSATATGEAVAALASFRARMEALGIASYRAVATSAVRESENGAEFLAKARKEAGLKIDTISGSEEARLVHRAVRSRLDPGGGTWLLADLGGGSVEVSLADGTGVLWSESHTMGAVRLLEELTDSLEAPGRFNTLLSEYVETLRVATAFDGKDISGFVATGGNIELLAQLALAAPGPDGVSRLPVKSIEKLIGQLSRLSYRERVETYEIKEDRADVILPAAMIYRRLARLAGAQEVLVPYVGVKEGMVLDMTDELLAPGELRNRHESQVEKAALGLGRKYRFDEPHGRHVARLSLSLFDQLKEIHGLNGRHRRILHAASLLHDIGSYVGYAKHHKHSLYILCQSSLAGFTPQEMSIVGNVARYHRRSMPKPSHEAYAALDPEARDAVLKLASILRLADALDREHGQKVRAVKTKAEGDVLRLGVDGTGDMLLERWALKRKADLLKRTFGLDLDVAP